MDGTHEKCFPSLFRTFGEVLVAGVLMKMTPSARLNPTARSFIYSAPSLLCAIVIEVLKCRGAGEVTGFLYVRNTDHSTLLQTPPGQNSSRHTVDSSAGARQPTKQFPLRKALPSPRRSQMTTNAETQMCAARSQRCCRPTTHTPNRFSGLQPSSAAT